MDLTPKIQLIPKTEQIIIGIRDPKFRTIYPVSWHDLKKMQGLFFTVMAQAVALSEEGYTNPQIYQFVVSKIVEHAAEIINAVIDGDPVDEKEISLEQAVELAEKIYVMNFEGISKNVKSLLQKAEMLMKKAKNL